MILVTGATGFLGKSVVTALLKGGNEPVRCFVRNETADDSFDSIMRETGGGTLELCKGSFTNISDLNRALSGAERVIHLASAKSGSVPVQIANNVVGSENLFIAAKSSNISRFVLCSSLGVIKASAVQKNGRIDEESKVDDHPEWRDAYSHSKIVQENLAWQYYREEKLPLVVVRPGVIFGPPDPLLTPRIGISLFGFFFHLGGGNVLPLTYKDNCADAIVEMAYQSNLDGQVFHVTDDDLPSSRKILRLYKRRVKAIRSIPLPYRVLRQVSKLNEWYSEKSFGHLPAIFTPYKVDTMWKGHLYSNAKIKKALGWTPRVSMQDALNLTLQHEATHKRQEYAK
jgi:nucleoside-diphosphate-sugar epimerase